MIKFGEWLPDLPARGNPGALTAKNVLPFKSPAGEVYYRPLSGPTIFSGVTSGGRVQGAANTVDTSGNYRAFAGTQTSLEILSAAGEWDDIKNGAGYSTATDGLWIFAQWGNDVIATNYSDDMQKYTLGVSSAFADLDSSAPRARYVAEVKNFIVAGNTFDAVDGAKPSRLRWSALGDPTNWTVDVSTQSDYQDLNSSKGWVQGIVGGQYGVIFQENAISRLEYVGSPDVFKIDEIEPSRGCLVPSSIIQVGHFIFYISQDGFYAFDRSESRPIGSAKVDKTFFSDFDQNKKDRVSVTTDPINKLIIWAYASTTATGGEPDKLVIFNWEHGNWSTAEVETTRIVKTVSLGYTLDTLDTYSTNMDTIEITLDSRFWTGGEALLAAFDRNNKLVYFTGSALPATLETTEFGEKEITEIQRIRPDIDASTVTVEMGIREAQGDTVTYGSSLSQEADGSIATRSLGRYHRIRATLPDGFTTAQGIDIIESSIEGER